MSERSYIDRDLFSRIARGDEAAFREFFHSYNVRLYPFLLGLVKSESDAREIVQDVFLKLWLGRDKLPTVENPAAWLTTLATHAAYDHLRKQARYEIALSRLESLQPDPGEAFWVGMDARELKNLLAEALRQLPSRRRKIFQLSKIEGLSRKEVAERLSISENTVRNQLAEAVDFVQDYIKKHGLVLVPVSIALLFY